MTVTVESLDLLDLRGNFPRPNLPKPSRPFFSAGPCVKPKEWRWDLLEPTLLGRSHRSVEAVACIAQITESLRALLEIPDTHLVGLTPGSATGALEMAMWNLLGPDKPVDVLEWDIFSSLWANAIDRELKIPVNRITGAIPDVFQNLNPDHDCLLTWCGTTYGACVGPHEEFLDQRGHKGGLVIADAASAVFTMKMPWEKLDVVTFSWQKGLGAEAASGVIVLGPRAVDRLLGYTPAWPINRLMTLKDSHGLMPSIFRGEMINTCSMMVMQEYAALLEIWHQRGGLGDALHRTNRNFQSVERWCQSHPSVDFTIDYAPCRAKGPVVLSIKDARFQSLNVVQQWAFLNELSAFLAQNNAGFEVLNHARAFPALRLWCGPAVDTEDLELLFPWIDVGLNYLLQRF
jgi:phosphoserine aminotransferase